MNKFIGIGRLTKDPEIKVTQNGTKVAKFTIAINRKFKKEETDFLNVLTFNKTAEFIEKYFTKGQEILIEGSVQTRSWENQDGKKSYATEIIANEVGFVGSKKDNASPTETEKEFYPLDNDDSLPF